GLEADVAVGAALGLGGAQRHGAIAWPLIWLDLDVAVALAALLGAGLGASGLADGRHAAVAGAGDAEVDVAALADEADVTVAARLGGGRFGTSTAAAHAAAGPGRRRFLTELHRVVFVGAEGE